MWTIQPVLAMQKTETKTDLTSMLHRMPNSNMRISAKVILVHVYTVVYMIALL